MRCDLINSRWARSPPGCSDSKAGLMLSAGLRTLVCDGTFSRRMERCAMKLGLSARRGSGWADA